MRYDNAGRLNSVTDPNGSYTYAYLANSNLRSAVTGPVHTATYAYELYRSVITTVENKVGVTTVSKYDYTVNSLGQRTQRANSGTAFDTASTDVFTYNTKGEVVGSTNTTLSSRDQSFNYDDIGNRLTFTTTAGTTSYTANSLNQYSGILPPSSSLLTPTYDLDGNQTDTATGQVYVWDAENRLVTVEPLIPTTGDKKQLNAYDAQSRRVRKQVSTYNGSSWELTTDEKFIYDGWNVVAKFLWNPSTSTFDLNSTYTWGLDLSGSLQGAGGVGGLLFVKDGDSVYHYTYDANGNVSEVLNNSSSIAAHYEYDAFGNTVVASGTYASTNTYRFSTKPLDEASDLYYYGFRYYSISAGRWLSRDPIEEQGGLNLYRMLGNDPLSLCDYLGLVETSGFGRGLLKVIQLAGFGYSELLIEILKTRGPWDIQGVELVRNWLHGFGDFYRDNDPGWTEYAKGDARMAQDVRNILLLKIVQGKMSAQVRFNEKKSAEFTNGENMIGYNYLHGSNMDEGGFVVAGTLDLGAGCKYRGRLRFVFNDKTDPNWDYMSDIVKSIGGGIASLGNARSFKTRISWEADIIVGRDPSGGWLWEGWPAN